MCLLSKQFAAPAPRARRTIWMIFCTSGSSKRRPISRLVAAKVFCGLVTAWRFAGAPTSRVPSLSTATTDGVVRAPSAFSITRTFLPCGNGSEDEGRGEWRGRGARASGGRGGSDGGDAAVPP